MPVKLDNDASTDTRAVSIRYRAILKRSRSDRRLEHELVASQSATHCVQKSPAVERGGRDRRHTAIIPMIFET